MEVQKELIISCTGAFNVELDEILELQGNLKDLSEDNYIKLAYSMIDYGFSFPFFLWIDQEGKKWIVDAHQRKRTLTRMRNVGIMKDGELLKFTIPSLPAVQIHAKDKVEAKKKLLLLNSRYGNVTQEGFYEYINEEGLEIPMEDFSELLYIPEVELEYTDSDNKVQATEDEEPKLDEENVKSTLGEVYQLGNHRLMCGDALSVSDVTKLMNGKKADVVFTDPPYGYSYQSNHQGKHKVLLNDDKFQDFFPIAIENTKENAAIYVFTAWQVVDKWIGLLNKSDLELKNMIIWKKNNWSMGDLEGSYAGQYEILLYAPKGRVLLEGGRDTDIWEYDRENPTNHPTTKPVGIAIKAIRKHDVEIVLDLFGGSGTTLMACEQTGASCYMMELSPAYCDVIRKRYAKFIGQEANWQVSTPCI